MGKTIKIKGTNIDDIFDMDEANVKVDGKKGIDLAIFNGAYEDFIVELKGTGNDKAKVTDGDGGTYEFKKVETLLFDGGTEGDFSDDVFFNTALGTTMRPDAEIDASGQTVGGNLLVGSGIPADDFVVVHSESAGLELGLNIRYRQGPAVDPISVDPDGTVRFEVNDGAQSTVNGSSSNNAARAAWSFQYSVITGLDGEPTDLSDYTFKLLIDTDVTEGVDFRELTMVEPAVPPGNATGFIWEDQDGTPTIGDDGGNANVAQNSENYAFGFIEDFIDADPDTPGQQDYAPGFGEAQFDIRLEAYSPGGDLVASNQIVVDVVDFA